MSRMERFSKRDDSHFSRRERDLLLNADGRHWSGALKSEQPATLEWRTAGESSRVALYNQIERVLTISTRDFIAKIAAARRAGFAKQSGNF